jgi:hypothetical protein
MGRETRSASASGSAIDKRLGSRSASKMNSEVTTVNENRKPMVCAVAGSSQRLAMPETKGLSAPSPTIPPRMATAFWPTCTTVKYSPGCSWTFITRSARGSPSSTICRNRRRREAASDISAMEKKALKLISKAMTKRLCVRFIDIHVGAVQTGCSHFSAKAVARGAPPV